MTDSLTTLVKKAISSEATKLLTQGVAQAASKAKQEAADYVASSLPNAVVSQVLEQHKPGRVARFLTNYATSPFYLLLAGGALGAGHQALTGNTELARYFSNLKEKYNTNLEAAGNTLPGFLKRMSEDMAHYPGELVGEFEEEKKHLRRRNRIADNVYKQYKTISRLPFGDKLLDVLDRLGEGQKEIGLRDLLFNKNGMAKQAGLGYGLMLSPLVLGGLLTAGAEAHKAYTGNPEWSDALADVKQRMVSGYEAGTSALGKTFGEFLKGKGYTDLKNIFQNEVERKRAATRLGLGFQRFMGEHPGIGQTFNKFTDWAGRGLRGLERIGDIAKTQLPEKTYRGAVDFARDNANKAQNWVQQQPWAQQAMPYINKAKKIYNSPVTQDLLKQTGVWETDAYKRIRDLNQRANQLAYPISPDDKRTIHSMYAMQNARLGL